MFYTVYKITNNVNGKFYIGKHQTTDLNDGYMGSGKLIKAAIKKHGIDNFTKEILEVYDNEKEMNEAEKRLVFLSEMSYNLCEGGKGGFGYINEKGMNWSSEHIQYMSDLAAKKNKGSKNPKTSERMKKMHQDGLYKNTGFGSEKGADPRYALEKALFPEIIEKRKKTYQKIGHQKGEKNSQYGKPRSEETKRKIRETLLKRFNNGSLV